jgi:hypothetical protein
LVLTCSFKNSLIVVAINLRSFISLFIYFTLYVNIQF